MTTAFSFLQQVGEPIREFNILEHPAVIGRARYMTTKVKKLLVYTSVLGIIVKAAIVVLLGIVCALSVSNRKAAIKRAQRKFTCKLHSEREQVQAHGAWLKPRINLAMPTAVGRTKPSPSP